MTTAFTTRSAQRAFDGQQGFYEHESAACAGPMRFSVYLPPAALRGEHVPAVYCLAGLTCTEETFVVKAGAQRSAAALGLALVTCDTSPRAARFAGDDEDWDFGQGAAFYIDAAQAPWSDAYQMHTYVAKELPALIETQFPVLPGVRGVLGHSMGGHGALTIGLRHPQTYRSVSAFAPIVAPSQVPWGQKAFTRYLGPEPAAWAQWDATQLVAQSRFASAPLIDQGTQDKFLHNQLRPELFLAACEAAGQPVSLRMREGYDHSYYFIATFIDEHLQHHARALRG